MSAPGSERAAVAVVGAGAAGLWAAEVAARLLGPHRRVVVLEKTPRSGTKVLASGGARCNLTTALAPDAARALFGQRGERFLAAAFRAAPPLEVRRRFAEWGVPTEEAPLEKVFPSSGRARDVRDALERAAVTAGARLELSAPVRGVERAGAGWRVLLDAGALEAERVIVACGGKSYPSTGTTGDGYAWLARLGLPVVEPRPALVPLRSPEPWVRELAGVALQDVEARLVDAPSGALARRRRPIVFTHAGLSGPAAMDLSGAVARRLPQPSTLAIDLLPATSREELRGKLVRLAAERGAAELAGCLGPAVPRRLAEAALRQAKLSPSARASALTRAGRHAFVEALKGLAVAIDGTLGWEKAELTGGGLALEALDPGTMQVKGLPGLFACGEILDLQGPIGGLSFQAAFATAELAGRAAARA